MTDNSLKEKSFKELETYSYIINIPFQCAVLNYSQRREEKKKNRTQQNNSCLASRRRAWHEGSKQGAV